MFARNGRSKGRHIVGYLGIVAGATLIVLSATAGLAIAAPAPKLDKLTVEAVCTVPGGDALFRIGNSNNIDVDYTWTLDKSSSTGAGTAHPGNNNYFSVPPSHENVRVFANGDQLLAPKENTDPCTATVTAAATTTAAPTTTTATTLATTTSTTAAPTTTEAPTTIATTTSTTAAPTTTATTLATTTSTTAAPTTTEAPTTIATTTEAPTSTTSTTVEQESTTEAPTSTTSTTVDEGSTTSTAQDEGTTTTTSTTVEGLITGESVTTAASTTDAPTTTLAPTSTLAPPPSLFSSTTLPGDDTTSTTTLTQTSTSNADPNAPESSGVAPSDDRSPELKGDAVDPASAEAARDTLPLTGGEAGLVAGLGLALVVAGLGVLGFAWGSATPGRHARRRRTIL